MSIEGRIGDIEMDYIESYTLSEIAQRNKFATTGDLGRFLCQNRQNDLWRKMQLREKAKVLPPRRAPRPTVTKPAKPPLAEILMDAGVKPDPAPPTPSPTREEPVVAQEAPEAPVAAPEEQEIIPASTMGYALANGSTSHRSGTSITYGERVWSYVEAALKSPKKRTAGKATRVQQAMYELIELVDEEAEEVKTLNRISELEAALAAEREKLRPRTASSVPDQTPEDGHGKVPGSKIRIWAREQGLEVPDQGKISNDLRRAYEEAHGE